MVSFEELRLDEDSPIYMQIIRYIKRGLAAGTIHSGEEMPSRRMLSTLLGVNPNTIQKACRMLEEEGLISSHTGAKSLITADGAQIQTIRTQLLRQEIGQVVTAFRQMGMDRERALELFLQLWDQEEETV